MTEKKVIQRKRDISREFGSRELLEKYVFILFYLFNRRKNDFLFHKYDMLARKK